MSRDIPPTPEMVRQREDSLARLIQTYPQGLARELADRQHAGWYIGKLFLINAITLNQLQAGERWLQIINDFGKLLHGPQPPGMINLEKRDHTQPSWLESKSEIDKFKRIRRQYTRHWDTLRNCGVPVFQATNDAIADKEASPELVKTGLHAMVRL